jgi:excisionase family DNA binding protein
MPEQALTSPEQKRTAARSGTGATARRIAGPEVLTRAEAAQVLGVHPSTVTRWAINGRLRHFRTPSGERRYRRCDVQDFLSRPRPERRAPYDGPVTRTS